MKQKTLEFIQETIEDISVEKQIKCFLKSDRECVIYGAGNQCRVTRELCGMYGKKCRAIVTSVKEISDLRYGVQVYQIDEFAENNDIKKYDFIISTANKYCTEIHEKLLACGCYEKQIFSCNDWKTVNESLRNAFYKNYLLYHGACYQPIKGGEIVKLSADYYKFRLFIPENAVYLSNTMGEFNDIILPSIFADDMIYSEGPYELLDNTNVSIQNGDVVIDCGANVGLFSSAAASKGAEVYAFEPTAKIIENALSLNASLYSNMHVFQMALSNQCGKTKFYVCDDTLDNVDIGNNTMYKERNPNYSETEVDTITIDQFVLENEIKHVDFIKADIEGAERYMLMGAQETLRTFAPKLALCTYHRLDDKEVMKKLILDANPSYIIIHRYEKLYAYVPRK